MAAIASRPGMRDSVSAPQTVWRSMTARSSGSSRPGLARIRSGTPILPMSWTRPAMPSSPSALGGRASRVPTATASSATSPASRPA